MKIYAINIKWHQFRNRQTRWKYLTVDQSTNRSQQLRHQLINLWNHPLHCRLIKSFVPFVSRNSNRKVDWRIICHHMTRVLVLPALNVEPSFSIQRECPVTSGNCISNSSTQAWQNDYDYFLISLQIQSFHFKLTFFDILVFGLGRLISFTTCYLVRSVSFLNFPNDGIFKGLSKAVCIFIVSNRNWRAKPTKMSLLTVR